MKYALNIGEDNFLPWLRATLIGLLLTFFFVPAFSLAAPVASVQLDTSATTVSVGDSFTVSIEMKAGTESGGLSLGQLTIPGIENFSQRGSYSQTQLQSINGVTAAVTKQTYELVAKKAGEYTIGPVSLTLPGAVSAISSNSVTIHVQKDGGFFASSKSKDQDQQSTPASPQDVTGGTPKTPSYPIEIDTVLILIIAGLLLFILYTQLKTPTKKTVPPETSATTEPSASSETDVVQTQESESVTHTDTSSPLFNLPSLVTLPEKELYAVVKEKIDAFLTSHPDLTDDQQQLLTHIRNECDVGKFAPPDPANHKRVIAKLNQYIETYGNKN